MSQTNDQNALTKEEEEALSAAVKLFQEENYEAAILSFNKLISDASEGDEKMKLYLCNRAAVLIELDRLDEAIADAVKAQQLDVKYPSSYLMQAKAYAYKDKKGQALDILKQGLSKNKESRTIQTEIMKLEGEIQMDNIVPKSDPTRQKINQYIDLLKNQGVERSKIAVKMLDQTTTMVLASRDIRAGETILFVPDDLVLHKENTADVPANKWLSWNTEIADKIKYKEQNQFALQYLHEKNNAKFKYKKYFESLEPTHFHPSLWEQKTINKLNGSHLMKEIEQQQKEIAADFELVRKEIPADSNDEFTLEEYRFAWTLADAHATGITKDGNISIAMVPFMNFFDIMEDACCELQYDAEKKGVSVVSKRNIMMGQNVSLTASTLSNEWLAMMNGAISLQRPITIPFTVQLNEQDPMYQQKVESMGNKCKGRTFPLSRDINTPSFIEYIHFIRFYFWTGPQEQLNMMRETEIQRKKDQKIPFTPETAFLGNISLSTNSTTEKLVWEFVYKQCQELAEAHGLNLIQAQEFLELAKSSEDPNAKLTATDELAWRYMIQEKTELGMLYQMAAMMLQLIEKNYRDAIVHLSKNPSYNPWSGYIKSTVLPVKMKEEKEGGK